jgi:hypothetical protein
MVLFRAGYIRTACCSAQWTIDPVVQAAILIPRNFHAFLLCWSGFHLYPDTYRQGDGAGDKHSSDACNSCGAVRPLAQPILGGWWKGDTERPSHLQRHRPSARRGRTGPSHQCEYRNLFNFLDGEGVPFLVSIVDFNGSGSFLANFCPWNWRRWFNNMWHE